MLISRGAREILEAKFRQYLEADFWAMASATRVESEYLANAHLRYLEEAPLDVLRTFFVQYRYFMIFCVSDLAILVSKLPTGTLRSSLDDLLRDALGNGDPARAHHRLYDDFLISFGVPDSDLDAGLERGNLSVLREIRDRVLQGSPAHAVGLRGMGGDCLSRVYLSAMYTHFRANRAVHKIEPTLDWRFWNLGAGEWNSVRRERLRAGIREIVANDPAALQELASGYRQSRHLFDLFWSDLCEATVGNQVGTISRDGLRRTVAR